MLPMRFLILLVTFSFVAGCGGPSNRVDLTGNVTFDGAPLTDGMIQFIPTGDVQGPPVQIEIKNGRYTAPAVTRPTIGPNTVQITSMKKTGKQVANIMGEKTDELIQYIPAKYNTESSLTVDIQRDTKELNFDLTSE